MKAADRISNHGKAYEYNATLQKWRIACSIFSKGLTFSPKTVRTLEVNEVVARILRIDKDFRRSKKRKHTEFGVLSLGVEPEGIEPSSKQGTDALSTCLANY